MKIVSILYESYAEYFGFTQKEVEEMLKCYGIADKREEVKTWYDGYRFGNTEVYNPWSVINYVEEMTEGDIEFPKPYWSNTSSNSIIRELVEQADDTVKQEIEILIAGGSLEKPIHEDITYEDIHKTQENLWNFLFFTGYLKAVSKRFEVDTLYMTFTIPNEEVRYIYRNTIREWFAQKIKREDFSDFYKAILAGNCEIVQEVIKKQLRSCISYYDNVESFYHGFLLGLLGGFPEYGIRSNRESGNGRPDLVLLPFDEKNPVVIMELKHARTFRDMEKLCAEALAQIDRQEYEADFLEEGYRSIVKYGICFCKKSCAVKKGK